MWVIHIGRKAIPITKAVFEGAGGLNYAQVKLDAFIDGRVVPKRRSPPNVFLLRRAIARLECIEGKSSKREAGKVYPSRRNPSLVYGTIKENQTKPVGDEGSVVRFFKTFS